MKNRRNIGSKKKRVCCQSGALLLAMVLWLCGCGRVEEEISDSLAEEVIVTAMEETKPTRNEQETNASETEEAEDEGTEPESVEPEQPGAAKSGIGKADALKAGSAKEETGKAEMSKMETAGTETAKTGASEPGTSATEMVKEDAAKTEISKTDGMDRSEPTTVQQPAAPPSTPSTAEKSHKFVTETKAASCETAGYTKVYCELCGYVESESQSFAAEEHNWNKVYWPSEPTCTCHGDYNMVCTKCGAVKESGTDPAIPHDPIYQEICHGDCSTETIVVASCRMCGLELGRECYYEADDHNWVEGTYEEFDWTLQQVVTRSIVQCSRCSAIQ